MMESRQVQFQNLDMMSSLPPNVIDVILTCLPLRDAVRTSILSRDWRYKWVTIPHLTFDERSFPTLADYSELNELKLINAVDQVLLLHKGPVHEFKCQIYLESCPAIDRWLLHLSDNAVKSFTLDNLRLERYKLPSCLFRYENLIHLQVSWCIFKPPRKFDGLRNLRTLHLQDISIDSSFEDFISKFPLLEALTLRNFDGLTCLNIQGPQLLYLDIVGKLKYLHFKNIPLVATALINMMSVNDYEKGKDSNLINVVGCLHGVKRLALEGFLLQFLAAGNVPERLPTMYNHLKNLTLKINFENLDQLSVVLCLCRSSPNLYEINAKVHSIDAASLPHESFWEVQEGFDGLFASLQIVTVNGIIGSKNELGFIEFVLENAPMLEEMNFKISATVTEAQSRIFRDLMGFRRASPQARIICLGK
ncbi:F-box/FBD/LRR-repeat protein At1g13570-like [Magnolia sinica]|uniref:F-box/FBD/LRR-repeat protein At1g13570-like n=1 Tax=Magnolia sinica TaxID=86752 RepID=UPI002659B068|nr:F-box/FBD/LRR-repeat protein At1g13570-like [Magnolia sinica]